jgi:hypothetical protein
MKRKVLIGALLWTAFITLLHVQLNVGWMRTWNKIQAFLGDEQREELLVGFLPVT